MASQQGYIGTLPSLKGAFPQTLSSGVTVTQTTNSITNITTYGALVLPFDIKKTLQEAKVQVDPKESTKQQGKLKSALKRGGKNFSAAVKSSQNIKVLTDYMQDKRNANKFGAVANVIGSKFSGIAVAQALMDGNVSSREALDYLFMGFAPAIGVQGSLMGYSGLNQIKDALFDGSIDVGAFVSGLRRTIKGGVDLKDMLTRKNARVGANILEFDLTISHNETYSSETPDRRVQSGQSLNEFVHNMPETFDVQCALQEGKRYSKAEFRAILKQVRDRKEVVSLILGDEMFDNLILTDFSPSHDCTKSGMDYNLSFKKVTWGKIDTTTEVIIQTKPEGLDSDINSDSSSKTGKLNSGKVGKGDMPYTGNMDASLKDGLTDSSYGKNTQGYAWTTTYWDMFHGRYDN